MYIYICYKLFAFKNPLTCLLNSWKMFGTNVGVFGGVWELFGGYVWTYLEVFEEVLRDT